MNDQLAFIFPGQGSQAVAMLSSFADSDVVAATFKEASDALGYDLWALCQEGPDTELNKTDKTQPALLTASVALWRLWQEQTSVQPSVLAGHSLGEYSALVCAGVFSLADAVQLVEARGQFMQQAVAEGSGKMAAIIGLDDALIVEACNEAAEGEVVSPVNYNSPGQVVIAGNADAVERAMVLCKEKGAKKAMPLKVSVPSHCALMSPAAEKLAEKLASIAFNTPNVAVINNVDVAKASSESDIRDALVRQLFNPVRWTETVQVMKEQGITTLVEMGPGKVLSGLNKRISRELTSYSVGEKEAFEKVIEELK
ncbi:ACP S-malonyltransferase [Pleionea sp. CnH1-48]|uniref:ACP S-malonyltransferase n=1 Tax=Pleionea sp. CnH1-48 TaxID=2954494 RepID=UPI00209841E3|nr:ACP S-malonyltransferase [Pleionea sp. CnH1-48]MCO7225866.1 ACP S-malonyltransferase [Pleionea sp. CnH1-48]